METQAEPYVNLWELITTVARHKDDLHNADKCQAIQAACSSARTFGTELSLAIDKNGGWVVEIFGHENGYPRVQLHVSANGRVVVERNLDRGSIQETHRVAF